MTCATADSMLLSSRDVCFPMPTLALAPAAWYLGAHMLKCIQEASLKIKAGCGHEPGRRMSRRTTADKSTQTVASFTQKRTQGRKTPTKGGPRRMDSKASVEDPKKSISGRRSVGEMKPSVRSAKVESVKRHPSMVKKSAKTEVTDQKKSGTPSSILKSRPTKGSMPSSRSRRLSTGDCPKRTSESCADLEKAKWLRNPVYASDGESDGRRTDRSEMSPPWLDISVAKEGRKGQQLDKKMPSANVPEKPSPTVEELARAVTRHVPAARKRSTQPKMDPVPEAPRPFDFKKDLPPKKPEASSTDRVLTVSESIRQTIERKIGKPLSEVDTASLKSISERRMRELTEKYARSRAKSGLPDRDIPASLVARNHPRARDSADSIFHPVDPQKGR